MTTKKMVSVIIVNYNGEKFIKNCLNSVLRTKYPAFEVIVVDNNSTDGSLKILEGFKGNSRVKIISLHRNLHFAGGNNIGIQYAKGEYLVFLNNDTIADPNWLMELVRIFEYDEDASAVQCLLLRMKDGGIDSIGGTIDYCGRPMPIRSLWVQNEDVRKERRLFYGCGAALAIRRNVLERVGVFDSDLPADEVDLCWRINLSGARILVAPKAIVYHFRAGAFGRKLNVKRIFLCEVASAVTILKNCEIPTIIKTIPYLTCFFIMAAGYDLLIRRRIDILISRLKARWHILKNLKSLLIKRYFVQKHIRKLPDAELRKLMIKPNPVYYIKKPPEVRRD